MSENRVIATEFKDWDLLLKAIEALSIPHEVAPKGRKLSMYGYQGDLRQDQADIVIRRQNVGHVSNDLGFVRNEDGAVTCIISAFDMGAGGKKRLDEIKQQYAVEFVHRQARRIGATVKQDRQADGTVVMRLVRR